MRYSSPKILLFATCAIFLTFGIFNTGIGTVLSELAAQTGSTLAAIGTIYTTLFFGSLVAQLLSGFLTDRFGHRLVLMVSVITMGIGILGFTNSHSITWSLILAFITGLGQGGMDLGANLVVADAFPKNNLPALNILHLFFGLGGAIGPALVSLSLGQFNKGMFVIWGAAILFFVMAIYLLFLRIKPREKYQSGSAIPQSEDTLKHIYLTPVLWILGGLMLLTVGIELGLGNWSTTYMTTTTGMNLQNAALVTSGYWAFLTVGRVAAAAASKFISQEKMLIFNIGSAAIGGIAFALFSRIQTPSIVALLFIGFCFGGIYPLVFSITTTVFHKHPGKAASIVMALGTVGGMSFPALLGVVLEKVNPIVFAWFIAGFIGLMFLIQFVIRRERHRNQKLSNL
jgi:fucose permease